MKIRWIDVLLFMLLVIALYLILTRVFGRSATDLQITVSLFTFLCGLLYKLNREFGEFKIKVFNAFGELKKDIEHLKK